MNIWVTGSEWKTTGDTLYSVFDIFTKYNIIFALDSLNLKSEIKEGDLIAVKRASKIYIFGKVLSKAIDINKLNISGLEKDLKYLGFPYFGWITSFKVELFNFNDVFNYNEKTYNEVKAYRQEIFNKINATHEKRVIDIFDRIQNEQKEINARNMLKIKTDDEIKTFFKKLKQYLEKESDVFKQNQSSNKREGKYQKLERPVILYQKDSKYFVYYIHFDINKRIFNFGIWDEFEKIKKDKAKLAKNTQSNYKYNTSSQKYISLHASNRPDILKNISEEINEKEVFPKIKEVIENIYNDFNNELKKTGIEKTESKKFEKGKMEFADRRDVFFDEYKTGDIFNNKENKLNICIKQIRIKKYQGIKNIQISNIPIDTQWIFLTGENGYGKTSILQAITIALFGNKDKGQILDIKEEIKYLLEYKNLNRIRINSNNNKEDEKFFEPLENFVTYGTSRLNKNVRPLNDSKTFNLFNTYGELLDIEDKLEKWKGNNKQNKYFKSAKKILLELLKPHVTDIEIIIEGSKTTVKYKETKDSELKEFKELATGFKSIIAMIGDMMIRLSENQPDIASFNELNGIVIIDELDLHLHPKFQKEIVLKLTKTFPKIQFIVSTHSPIPLLGAPKNSIIINVNRNEKDGITAEILDIDITTLTPNSILTSPIFGFENLISTSKPNDKFLNTEDDYNKITEKQKMRKELSEYLTPEKAERMFNLLNSEK